MVFIDRQDFDKKCSAIIEDVEKQKITSSAWGWIGLGAFAGLLLSCIKSKKPTSKPILMNYTRVKDIDKEE